MTLKELSEITVGSDYTLLRLARKRVPASWLDLNLARDGELSGHHRTRLNGRSSPAGDVFKVDTLPSGGYEVLVSFRSAPLLAYIKQGNRKCLKLIL